VVELRAGAGCDPLAVESCVDRVRSSATRVQLPPQREEPVVVGTTAERARTMSGGECGRLVEEEELGESPGL